jgi:hypothetical protein
MLVAVSNGVNWILNLNLSFIKTSHLCPVMRHKFKLIIALHARFVILTVFLLQEKTIIVQGLQIQK